MNNRVLVIHTDKESAGFEIFQTLYMNKAYTVVDEPDISPDELRRLITEHDVVILIGCFCHDGFLATNTITRKDFVLIDDSYIELLRQKTVYSIGGRRYFERHNVPGLHTGTILTSSFEASLYEIDTPEEEIINSALRLISIIGDTIQVQTPREKKAKILTEYDGFDPMSLFNINEIIAL
jgi:hypothetical protein